MSNIKKNTLFYMMQYGVTAVVNLAVSPWMLHAMGVNAFGAWKSAMRLIELGTLADGRAGVALKLNLPAAIANGASSDSLSSLAGECYRRWAVNLPFCLILTTAIALVVASALGNGRDVLFRDLVAFGVLMTIAYCLTSLYALPDAILNAAGQSYISSSVQMAGVAAMGIGCLIVVTKDNPLAWLGALALGIAVLVCAALHFIVLSRFEWFSISGRSKEYRTKISSDAGWSFAWGCIEKLMLALEVILITVFCQAKDVAVYTFGTYVYQLAVTVALISTSAITPALASAYSVGDKRRVEDLVRRARRQVSLLATGSSIAILVGNEQFVKMWAGADMAPGYLFSAIVALSLWQLSSIRCEGQLMDSAVSIRGKTLAFAAAIVLAAIGVAALKFAKGSLSALDVMCVVLATRTPLAIVMSRLSAGIYPSLTSRSRMLASWGSQGMIMCFCVAVLVR